MNEEKMVMYIKNRKIDGIHQRAMTVFDEKRNVLFSDQSRINNQDMEKFEKTLIAIKIALKQFKNLTLNGMIDDSKPLDIIISSKMIFKWLKERKCPNKYLNHFEDIQLELSFLTNPTRLCYKKLKNKAKYKDSISEKRESVIDFLENFN